jgi:hypothetical protein
MELESSSPYPQEPAILKYSPWHVQPKTIFLHSHCKCVRIPLEQTGRSRCVIYVEFECSSDKCCVVLWSAVYPRAWSSISWRKLTFMFLVTSCWEIRFRSAVKCFFYNFWWKLSFLALNLCYWSWLKTAMLSRTFKGWYKFKTGGLTPCCVGNLKLVQI